jgi:hypothetical protein
MKNYLSMLTAVVSLKELAALLDDVLRNGKTGRS